MTTTRNDQPAAKKRQICRFYTTKKGCRAGEQCPFLHDASEAKSVTSIENSPQSKPIQTQRPPAPVVDQSRVVSKPQPVVEDARSFQLGQIRRRFKPQESSHQNSDQFSFSMAPSDPDFPYEIDTLACVLTIPKTYPGNGRPSLKITNKEIPRGFQINVERGFAAIVAAAPDATLLGLMNRLDRQLESILSGEVAETIKIVAHRPAKEESKPVVEQALPTPQPLPATKITPRAPEPSEHEKSAARQKRQLHIRQLEARFGRVPAFSSSNDGYTFTLPLDSPKKATWPSSLQSLRIFKLLVPDSYPLDPASIMLDSDSPESRKVEQSFVRRGKIQYDATLTQLVNQLIVNLKEMSQEDEEDIEKTEKLPPTNHTAVDETVSTSEQHPTRHLETRETDKPHVHIIPRPPEWDSINGEDSDEDDSDGWQETPSSSEIDSADEKHETSQTNALPSTIERGILLSFPNLELHGIELMELQSLGITIKCERCKDTMDVEKLRGITTENTGQRLERCKKCANPFTIGFRADMIHVNSVRAGYVDLEGCTIVDMLLSTFLPTCSECSTQAPGVVSVRGESTMAICRECHRKMSFRIPEVKFLQISAAAIRASRAPGRRKAKENLGIVAGTELPRRGRCSHYSKSYRWFRFSCCNKVFACDRCHDEEADHPNEHANRMLCGYCSREQNYRPEDCSICHAVLIGKKGHGFWEGGKGTRDKSRMSRKDPRKFKRIGGSVKK